jgi:pullulanase/glycogen debranching enzyme
MICHGDELGRTQGGNNNGYCQDNEITWIDWAKADKDLLEFTRSVSALRAAHPVFRRRRFFSGKPVGRRGAAGLPDISWFAPDGSEMTGEDWGSGFAKSVGSSSTARASPTATPGASGSPTIRSCCASTPTTRTSSSRCRRPSSARGGNR